MFYKIFVGAMILYSANSSAAIYCNKGESYLSRVDVSNDPKCASNMAVVMPKFASQLFCVTASVKLRAGNYNLCLKLNERLITAAELSDQN